MQYFSILDCPAQVCGFATAKENEFIRLPKDIINDVNDGVSGLARHSAGGRVCLRTASPQIFIKITLIGGGLMSHMALSGQSGADCMFTQQDGKVYYAGCIRPENAEQISYEGVYSRPNTDGSIADAVIHLPLYNGISHMEIAVCDGYEILPPTPYQYSKPIVFYGSSITQGGCASRPSNAYTAILAQDMDADHINLGFSGSARGEEILAHYISELNMSAFVYDYDHNAPDAEHLNNTHKKFFDIIRAKNPELPIIIVTKPDFDTDIIGNAQRREIVRSTYECAVSAGDTNIAFVDGERLFGEKHREHCTVDGTHPNDAGFFSMAQIIGEAVRSLLIK